VISADIDNAITAVIEKSGGLVQAGPKYYVPDCSMVPDDITTLTDNAVHSRARTHRLLQDASVECRCSAGEPRRIVVDATPWRRCADFVTIAGPTER